MKRTNCRAYSR